ncbi:MAG TPA: exodeoxyribonuclease III [Sedimentisphaerales bacterium]|jgi:exodeoxyribonuclease-3|nr:exodeoxyribonuclease III [Sedimentisphaerales bacterium]HNU28002.1 exodeoxyribonuclease III [Sedimentisphaerales bacterium]
MRIASFNVNSIRVRLPIVLSWLQKNRPDILAVQETKVQDADFPREAFREIGYACAFRGQKTYNGVAILSPHEIERVEFGLPDEPKDEPRIVTAAIRGITIVNTYVPQGYLATSERFQYKLDWLKRLLAYFRERFRPNEPVLWVGDLNVAPLPIDVYDPVALEGHVCYHPTVRRALAEVMEWGFADLFRKHCSEPGQYTFWDYRIGNFFQKNRGWRIDHILGTAPLADRCTACTIDKEPRAAERPSDHTPIIAEIA